MDDDSASEAREIFVEALMKQSLEKLRILAMRDISEVSESNRALRLPFIFANEHCLLPLFNL